MVTLSHATMRLEHRLRAMNDSWTESRTSSGMPSLRSESHSGNQPVEFRMRPGLTAHVRGDNSSRSSVTSHTLTLTPTPSMLASRTNLPASGVSLNDYEESASEVMTGNMPYMASVPVAKEV